jgi:hypothetical protein
LYWSAFARPDVFGFALVGNRQSFVDTVRLSRYNFSTTSQIEVFTMKKMAFVGPINNGWALLTFGEMEEEMMDVPVATLWQHIGSEVCEEDFLEITFASDGKTIIGAQKLVEETKKRKKKAIARMNRLAYGTSRGQNV